MDAIPVNQRLLRNHRTTGFITVAADRKGRNWVTDRYVLLRQDIAPDWARDLPVGRYRPTRPYQADPKVELTSEPHVSPSVLRTYIDAPKGRVIDYASGVTMTNGIPVRRLVSTKGETLIYAPWYDQLCDLLPDDHVWVRGPWSPTVFTRPRRGTTPPRIDAIVAPVAPGEGTA